MNIIDALAQLDPENDGQWTKDGLPAMDTLQVIMGQDITRQQVTDAAPRFTRTNPDLSGAAQSAGDDAPQPVVTQTDEEAEGPSDLAAQLAELQEQIQTTQKYLEDGKRHLQTLYQQETALIEALHEAGEVETTQQHISAYLQAQKAQLAARAESVARMREAGITPDMLRNALGSPGSPLDQALRRKR